MKSHYRWTHKHLLTIEELSADDIRFVLDTADGSVAPTQTGPYAQYVFSPEFGSAML